MIVPCPQEQQTRISLPLLPGEAVARRPAALAPQRHAEGRVALRQRDFSIRVGQLPHAAQPVVQMPGPGGAVVLGQEIATIDVPDRLSPGGLHQDLGQAEHRHDIVRRHAVLSLRHPVPLAVVSERGCKSAADHLD